MSISKISLALAASAAALVATNAHATAFILTNATYTQDFNTLANTGTSSVLPAGFSIFEMGQNANTLFTAGTGSSNGGDTYSFGAAGSTDRALGGLRSGNLIPLFGAQFTNGLGRTITSFAINYTGELWRLGVASGRTDSLLFEFSTDATSLMNGTYMGVASLNFVTPNTAGAVGARDGNLAANRALLSGTIGGLQLLQGQSIFVRFRDIDATGADDGLGIDDFSLVATTLNAVPEPATWAMMITGFGLVGGAMRKRKAKVVFA